MNRSVSGLDLETHGTKYSAINGLSSRFAFFLLPSLSLSPLYFFAIQSMDAGIFLYIPACLVFALFACHLGF